MKFKPNILFTLGASGRAIHLFIDNLQQLNSGGSH